MSGFIRPEAAAFVRRWREALISACVALFGIWVALSPGPVVAGLGWIIAAIGALLLVLSLRRIRFSRAGDGPGVVTLDEGRVSYLGPYYGGSLALQDMIRLALRRAKDGKSYWVLVDVDGLVVIPINAVGADVLFDAFTTLDGLSMPHLLRQLDKKEPGTVTLWSAEAPLALT